MLTHTFGNQAMRLLAILDVLGRVLSDFRSALIFLEWAICIVPIMRGRHRERHLNGHCSSVKRTKRDPPRVNLPQAPNVRQRFEYIANLIRPYAMSRRWARRVRQLNS